ncbi:hypothetical protein P7C73_g3529, partial [Tremellales sp. Uapishka_1]
MPSSSAFDHVVSWLEDLKAHADENVSIILVANKIDLCTSTPPQPILPIAYGQAVLPSSPPASPDPSLKARAVSSNQGALFAKQHGLLYVETSAKEGWGVEEAFEWTAREILEKVEQQAITLKQRSGVKVQEGKEIKGKCC